MSRKDHRYRDGEFQRLRTVLPRDLHPVVKWLRTAGIGAEFFGWGGLLLAGWFWPGVAFIYAGFLLLAIDVWLEPGLQRSLLWRIGIVTILLLFTTAFSLGIVFVKAPLDVSAFVTAAEYPTGTSIAGIPWKPQFTELQVRIDNPSDRNYEDVNLLIRPMSAIVAIAQVTSVPNVSFEDNHALSMRLMNINVGTMKATAIPLVLLATDAGVTDHAMLLLKPLKSWRFN